MKPPSGVIKTISISSDPWSVVVNQKTNTVYVASGTSKIIHVIDGETDEIVQKLEPDYKPWGLSINEGSDVLYVTSWESSFIDVIDLKNNLKRAEIPITSGAWQMDTDQFSGITAVLNEHSNELYLLDDNSKHFKTITLYDSSQSVVISPLADKVFLTNPLSGSVSSIALKYEHSEMDSIIENIISDNDSRNDELILDVLKGLSDAPNRHDVDSDLISGLLQNVGITGDVNGNEIARLLIEDYNEKKEKEPKSVAVPFWTIELASMFADETQYQIPDNVDCGNDSFSPIHDYENVNPFEIWINILPICALS